MNLRGVQPGDILRVDDGLEWYGRVIERPQGGRVKLTFLSKPMASPRVAKSTDVIGVWKKTRATKAREQARVLS